MLLHRMKKAGYLCGHSLNLKRVDTKIANETMKSELTRQHPRSNNYLNVKKKLYEQRGLLDKPNGLDGVRERRYKATKSGEFTCPTGLDCL